ncbi:MAG: hypothetical protein WBA17_14980 [Saprospiraceae bacterium]
MRHLLALLFALTLLGCHTFRDSAEDVLTIPDPNPAAPGFNTAGSDARAIAIADSVVLAHGGRRAYDATRFLKWNFFGARSLTWDKQQGRVRIESPRNEMIYLLDVTNNTGRVQQSGMEITQPDSLKKYVGQGISIWINDSYWLVQQFKLKDSGTTLTYRGSAPAPETGQMAEVIELTFQNVGDTPQNRYRLFVDPATYRIATWQFFRAAEDAEPAISTPWNGYEKYGDIYLSGDRGGRFQLTDIAAPAIVADTVFEQF